MLTTMSRSGAMVAAAVLALLSSTAPAFGEETLARNADPAALVDPFVGTGSGGQVVGDVDTFPGASMPFGMVQFSPDTPRRPAGGGYAYADNQISGFSLTHLSGAGCGVAGDIPFLPMTGAVPADPTGANEPFTHADEQASPGSYGVTLGPTGGQVRVEETATARTGLAMLTYPRTKQAQLLVKAAGSANGSSGATFHPVGTNEIAGSVTSGHFCGQPDSYTVYFDAKFDRAFTASGTWGGANVPSVRQSVA